MFNFFRTKPTSPAVPERAEPGDVLARFDEVVGRLGRKVAARHAFRSAARLRRLELWIDRAVDCLPSSLRAVVICCDLDGCDAAEAARVLDCSPREVRERLTQGYEQLCLWLATRGQRWSAAGLRCWLRRVSEPTGAAERVLAVTVESALGAAPVQGIGASAEGQAQRVADLVARTLAILE